MIIVIKQSETLAPHLILYYFCFNIFIITIAPPCNSKKYITTTK